MSGIIAAVSSSVAKVGFSPLNIAGCVGWFDPSNATSITKDGSNNISQWNDLSGSGNYGTASGSTRPVLENAAQNGLNTVRFTASGTQLLTLNSPIAISAATLICVINRGGPTGSNNMLPLGNAGATPMYLFQWYIDENYYIDSPTNFTYSSSVDAATGYQVFSVTSSGSSFSLRKNGSPIALAAAIASIKTSGFTRIGAGGGFYSNGELGEMCLYDSVLSTGNKQLVEAYLKSKWGTP